MSTTLARVLLMLSGFVSVANGVLELGPEATTRINIVGVALILVGLLTWFAVWRLGRRRLPSLALAVAIAVTVVRGWQFSLLHTPTVLFTIVLPVVAWLRLRSASGPPRRAVAFLGATAITAAVLVVVTGGALAAALAPCHLPPAQANGLNNDQNNGDGTRDTPPTGYVTATDGARLAYFAAVPADPVASLVFYHGSGANSRAGYLGLLQLAAKYHIATYLFDMRGHGASDGKRGDAPSQRQMFADTHSAINFVHRAQPTVPEFAGGHSAGAGLILNSESRIDDEVAGYVYLAPDFGLKSGTEQQNDAANFVTICQRPLIADVVTNGLIDAHTYAVGFAYTSDQIARAGLVDRYTTTMAIAQDPRTSATVLAGTHKPIGVWIGSADEVFNPTKVIAYATKAPYATTSEIPGANHLGVIDRSLDSVGPWLDREATAAKH